MLHFIIKFNTKRMLCDIILLGGAKMSEIIKSTTELAKTLGVSTQTIYRWINDKNMPYIQLPTGRKGYKLEDIEKWLLADKRNS